MIKQFEQVDISGDVGLKVWGQDLEELFENAARGMSELITDVSAIPDSEQREVHVVAESIEDLLVQWLNELVFLYDTYGFSGKQFTLHIDKNALTSPPGNTALSISLNAVISGGTFNPDIHEKRLLIKAATYHNLTLGKKNSTWEATVIFDI